MCFLRRRIYYETNEAEAEGPHHPETTQTVDCSAQCLVARGPIAVQAPGPKKVGSPLITMSPFIFLASVIAYCLKCFLVVFSKS